MLLKKQSLLLAFLLYMKPKGNHSVYSGGKKICQTFVKISVMNSDPPFRLLIGANRRADEQVRVAMPAGWLTLQNHHKCVSATFPLKLRNCYMKAGELM